MPQEIVRTKNEETSSNYSSNRVLKSDISTLNIGLIDRRPKNNQSIFSCCNKVIMDIFKKNKTDGEL